MIAEAEVARLTRERDEALLGATGATKQFLSMQSRALAAEAEVTRLREQVRGMKATETIAAQMASGDLRTVARARADALGWVLSLFATKEEKT